MEGLPVTIRLLDPPLHEFLPAAEDVAREVERARIEQSPDLDELERTLEGVHALQETNPMLGTRGVPAGDPPPRDLRDAGARRSCGPRSRSRERTGEAPELEIMVPLVAYEKELEFMRELIVREVGAQRAAATSS